MTARWTTPADVKERARRRWDDGSLLRCYAAGEAFPVIDVPLRRPRVAEIGAHLGAVQRWVADLDTGANGGTRYTLVRTPVGGRLIGRNELPSRAVVSSYAQAWALLGVAAAVRSYDEILAVTEPEPVVRSWVGAHPRKALVPDTDWPGLLAAYRWLDGARGSRRHLREISAPGVDTKFVERHRGVLASLLGVPTAGPAFVAGLGLAAKPELLRLRVDPALGAFASLTDVTARVAELRALDLRVRTAVIVENETTFLSLSVPSAGVLLWGKGFEVDRAGSLPWLRDVPVSYWGDLDTHGFAILDRLRAWLPQTRSVLMDRETLLAHRDRWVTEAAPTRARLGRLTPEEAALYDDLVADRFDAQVRLEQERVDWAWVMRHRDFMTRTEVTT